MATIVKLLVLVGLLGFLMSQCRDSRSPVPSHQATTPGRPIPGKSQAALKAECEQELERRRSQYATHMKAMAYWAAAAELRNCAGLLKRDDLAALVKDAEVKSYMQDINSPNVAPRDKVRAMEMFARDYPDLGAKYASQATALLKRLDAEEARALAARRRSEGVSIGMTAEEVRASSWGKPQSINRTTNAYGVHEQWVYGGGYLYFDNGVLTSIQN